MSLILIHYVTYLISPFAEIMSNNIDMNKLCARVGGHHNLAAGFQATKKKSGSTSSTNIASAQNDSSGAPSDNVAGGSAFLITEIQMQPKAFVPPVVTV